MIRFPAGRFLTFPLPPVFRAALAFAAVILPPLLFLAILDPPFLLLLIAHRRGTEKQDELRHVPSGTTTACPGRSFPPPGCRRSCRGRSVLHAEIVKRRAGQAQWGVHPIALLPTSRRAVVLNNTHERTVSAHGCRFHAPAPVGIGMPCFSSLHLMAQESQLRRGFPGRERSPR